MESLQELTSTYSRPAKETFSIYRSFLHSVRMSHVNEYARFIKHALQLLCTLFGIHFSSCMLPSGFI